MLTRRAVLSAICAAGIPVAARAASPGTALVQPERDCLAASQAKLAWALLSGLAPRGDPTISPASLAVLLRVLSEGADAGMKSAIVKALGFEGSPPGDSLNALWDARKALATLDPSVFVSKDRLVFDVRFEPTNVMQTRLTKIDVPFSVADLTKQATVDEINAWVKTATNGLIPSVLDAPIRDGALVAVNAIHFKDKWETPFPKSASKAAPFHAVDGSTSPALMMRSPVGEFEIREEADFIAARLPFRQSRFELIVVTSKNTPRRPEDFATVSSWLSGTGFTTQKGFVALPRFVVDYQTNLAPLLMGFGLEDGISPTAWNDFSGRAFRLDDIFQKTKMEVDEEGAEAAAATSGVVEAAARSPPRLFEMIVDKPFLYALRDRDSSMVLIAGFFSRAPKPK